MLAGLDHAISDLFFALLMVEAKMSPSKASGSKIGAAMAASGLGVLGLLVLGSLVLGLGGVISSDVAAANSLGTVDGMPFWGHPYPYGFVYHRPPIQCYDIRTVDTPRGPMIQETWICDAPVTARY